MLRGPRGISFLRLCAGMVRLLYTNEPELARFFARLQLFPLAHQGRG